MSDIYQYEKAILLTREPVDAALAEFNRRYKGHRGFAPDSAFLEGESESILTNLIKYPP